MRAKPDMKPWVHTDKSKMSSVGAALTELVLALRCGCVAPLGLNKCVPMINPGLAPWAMKEYRPCRAPLRLPYRFIILMRLPCSIYEYLGKGIYSKTIYIGIKREKTPSLTTKSLLQNWQLPTLPLYAVPSARLGLTSLFGMGRGGSPTL